MGAGLDALVSIVRGIARGIIGALERAILMLEQQPMAVAGPVIALLTSSSGALRAARCRDPGSRRAHDAFFSAETSSSFDIFERPEMSAFAARS